jgi:hypothetical protein
MGLGNRPCGPRFESIFWGRKKMGIRKNMQRLTVFWTMLSLFTVLPTSVSAGNIDYEINLSDKKNVLTFLDSVIEISSCEEIMRKISGSSELFTNDTCTGSGKVVHQVLREIKVEAGSLIEAYSANKLDDKNGFLGGHGATYHNLWIHVELFNGKWKFVGSHFCR